MQILGPADSLNIVRIQFALMKPGTSDIKLHIDSGGYAKHGHRIHIPIITHPHVSFDVCPLPAPPDHTAAAAAADSAPDSGPTPADAAPFVSDNFAVEEHHDDADSSSSSSSRGVPPSSRWWWMHSDRSQPLQPSRQQQQHLQQHQLQQRGQQQMQAPSPLHRNLLANQQQQQQQHDSKQPKMCVKIPAPEGLVFELNNRVEHMVANPGPGASSTISHCPSTSSRFLDVILLWTG
jgi:hypothetical protein